MGWGRAKVETKPSVLVQLIPLILLIIVLAGAAWVGYQIYVGVNKIQKNAEASMAKRNMVFTRDGMKVGVRQVENEKYVDATQGWFVKAWNLGQQKPSSKKA